MSALWTPPASGDDLVHAITTARRLRDAALGRALAHLVAHAADAGRTLARRAGAALRAGRTRRVLLGLDARQLRDIGLTRADIAGEAEALRPLSMLFAGSVPASAGPLRQPGEHGGRAW